MSNKDTQFDSVMDEINSARNMVEREMLLQKYGLVDPKLMHGELEYWEIVELAKGFGGFND
jgi:hypothetical protein